MIINIEHYHRDVTYKGLKTYLSFGKIGICCLENGKRTMPSFDCVIFSDKRVFVEANGLWGILDSNLCLIAPPIYKELFPVNRIDRDSYISSCMTNQDAVSLTLNSNSSTPTHIAIQTKEINTDKIYDRYGEGLLPTFYHRNIDDEDKACIYEVTNGLENVKTDLFVTFSGEGTQLINIAELEIKQNTGFRGYEFFPLWHYKDNMFIVRNNNGTYVTSTYKDGRFTRKSLWGEYDDSFEEYGSPKVVLHRGEFVSVSYPENYRFIGSPFANRDKEKEFDKKSGKWALFKYHHTKIEEGDKGWHKHFSNEDTCFEQLTSFVFEEYATQLPNDNEFICHGDGMDFFMRFEQEGMKTQESVKVDEKYETKYCSQGHLTIIACYNTIELREDGLFDITTKGGCGLCDQNMRVIVPSKYDYPIECGKHIMIGVKESGSVNNLKQYGYVFGKISDSILTSDELEDDIHYLSGNSSEGFSELEEIIITKDVNIIKWNGLGRCRFRKFSVVPENNVFCEVDDVLYTQKGYDREGNTDRKHMIELVACPTNVTSHNVMYGTKRISNCAFKGTKIETLNLPDTLEEIGVNAFYYTPNLKYIKLPKSIRKIEAQDVGKSGDSSPRIEYDAHSFDNWASLYEYMLRNGFDKRNGNITKTRI